MLCQNASHGESRMQRSRACESPAPGSFSYGAAPPSTRTSARRLDGNWGLCGCEPRPEAVLSALFGAVQVSGPVAAVLVSGSVICVEVAFFDTEASFDTEAFFGSKSFFGSEILLFFIPLSQEMKRMGDRAEIIL